MENPGVGTVVKNTVANIMILKRANDARMQKIITMRAVAVKKLDSRKRIIVRVDTAVTVVADGNIDYLQYK